MVTKKEKALNGSPLSLAYKVDNQEYTVLKVDPHPDGDSGGEITLITSGTVSIKEETLGKIVDEWDNVNTPPEDARSQRTMHKMTHTECNNISAMLEKYVERYGRDATANDIVIHERA